MQRIVSRGNTSGLSPLAVVLNTTISTLHLVLILACSCTRRGNEDKTSDSRRRFGSFGRMMIMPTAIYCVYTFAMYAGVLYHVPINLLDANIASADYDNIRLVLFAKFPQSPMSNSSDTHESGLTSKSSLSLVTLTFCLLYAAALLIPNLLFVSSSKYRNDLGFALFIGGIMHYRAPPCDSPNLPPDTDADPHDMACRPPPRVPQPAFIGATDNLLRPFKWHMVAQTAISFPAWSTGAVPRTTRCMGKLHVLVDAS